MLMPTHQKIIKLTFISSANICQGYTYQTNCEISCFFVSTGYTKFSFILTIDFFILFTADLLDKKALRHVCSIIFSSTIFIMVSPDSLCILLTHSYLFIMNHEQSLLASTPCRLILILGICLYTTTAQVKLHVVDENLKRRQKACRNELVCYNAHATMYHSSL